MSRLQVASPDLARAAIETLGAQVASWEPAECGEQLFMAAHAVAGEKTFKGGIPICWPQFGPGPLPQHGFARDLDWVPSGHGQAGAASWAALKLDHAGDCATRFPHPFCLELRLAVHGPRLTVTLTVENTGSREWFFTAALHTYLKVADVTAATVEGLGGVHYLDKTRDGQEAVQAERDLRLSGETDRVYLAAKSPLRLRDGDRTLEIAEQGFADVVVWNPWNGAERRWPQFGPDDWRHFICIEAAVVQRPVTLAKGGRWVGAQVLTVLA